MARQLARRQRRERLAGFALAALGVVVLVVALIALRQPSQNSTIAGSATSSPTASAGRSSSRPASTSPSPSASRPSSSAPSSPPASSSAATDAKLPLVVLNNTTVTGLAAQASDRFRAGGWTVTSFGNYQNDILSTCAYFDPAVPNAERDARRLQAQFPAIKRVAPKFAELPAGPIVVVLTPDYS